MGGLRSWEGGTPAEDHSGEKVIEGANRPVSRRQHLQEDRDGLHGTVELLQVRVRSLTHILSIQEQELARKVGRAPPLWGEAGCTPDPAKIFPEHLFLCLLSLGQNRGKPICCLFPLLP